MKGGKLAAGATVVAVVGGRLLVRRTGEIRSEHLATHMLPLEEGPKGYDMFKNKEDGCVRAVFQPRGNGRPS